jgi:hypothetical protein
MNAQPAFASDCDCQERDCVCPSGTYEEFSRDGRERTVYANTGQPLAFFRLCKWCDEEIELEDQPMDDTRQYCDETCAMGDRL